MITRDGAATFQEAELDALPPADAIARIEGAAERFETACGAGTMVWRDWGRGEPLVLFHGGYGTWAHWIRTIPAMMSRYRVLCPDMPGFGDSAMPPEPYSAESLTEIVGNGLEAILGGSRCHIAGFSFGGLIAGHVARRLGRQARSLVLVGSGGLGARRGPMPDLIRRSPNMTSREIDEAQRRNLEILMFADPRRIDPLAVHIQRTNTEKARVKSRPISKIDTLARALRDVEAPLKAVWGERDAPAGPYLGEREQILRSVRPAVDFRVIEGAGHWVMYEAPGRFNELFLSLLAPESGTP